MGDLEQLGNVLGRSGFNDNRGGRDARGRGWRDNARRIVPTDRDVSLFSEMVTGDVLSSDEQEERILPDAIAKPQRALLRVVPSDTSRDDATAEGVSQDVCPRCRGAQWLRCDLPLWHPKYKNSIECECLLQKRREKRRQQLIALSGLPAADLVPTLQTFRPHVRGVQEAFRVTKEFINGASEIQEASGDRQRQAILGRLGWIVLRGPVGVGKSHLAMAVSAVALELGIETLFATAPDLLDHLRTAFAPSSEIVYDDLFERMKKAELLVLDDLGTQRSNSWVDEKLFQLFNYRYNHRLPTFVTLNERAWNYLDERLQSRMTDVSLVQLVVVRDAQDYRPRQRKDAAASSGSPDSKEE